MSTPNARVPRRPSNSKNAAGWTQRDPMTRRRSNSTISSAASQSSTSTCSSLISASTASSKTSHESTTSLGLLAGHRPPVATPSVHLCLASSKGTRARKGSPSRPSAPTNTRPQNMRRRSPQLSDASSQCSSRTPGNAKDRIVCSSCAKNIVIAHAQAVKETPAGCKDTKRYAKRFIAALGDAAVLTSKVALIGTIDACAFCGLAVAGALAAPKYALGAAGVAVGFLCGTALSILTPLTGLPAFLGFEVAAIFGVFSTMLSEVLPPSFLVGLPIAGASLKLLTVTNTISEDTARDVIPVFAPGVFFVMAAQGP